MVLNVTCEQLGIKILFSIPFYPKSNSRIKNMHNFLKRILTNFLESGDLEWGELLPFACYCYNTFPRHNGTESQYFLMFVSEASRRPTNPTQYL